MILRNKYWKIGIHANKKIWYKYIIPKRLTLKQNPPIYRWTFFVWSK